MELDLIDSEGKYLCQFQKKHNEELRKFEKRLIKRLYTDPMNSMRKLKKKKYEISLEDSYANINGSYDMKKSYSDLDKSGNKRFRRINEVGPNENNDISSNKCEEEKKNNKDYMTVGYNNNGEYINEKLFRKGFNTICNFHNKFGKKKNNLFIHTNYDNNMNFNHISNKKFKKYLDFNKTYSGINNHKTQYKFTDPKLINNHKMKIAFNFKQKPKEEKIKSLNFE